MGSRERAELAAQKHTVTENSNDGKKCDKRGVSEGKQFFAGQHRGVSCKV